MTTTMTKPATETTTKTYREILQAIVCDRYADRDVAFCAIDTAFQAGSLTQMQARLLESRVG